MRAHEFSQDVSNEGVLSDLFKEWIPKALRMWLQKKLQKGQYDALVKVYNEIMQDQLSPPESPQDALYRAAKTVGLDQRTIYDIFGDKGVPGEI